MPKEKQTYIKYLQNTLAPQYKRLEMFIHNNSNLKKVISISALIVFLNFLNNLFEFNANLKLFVVSNLDPQNYLSPNNSANKVAELMGEPFSENHDDSKIVRIYLKDNLWVKHITDQSGNPIAISFNSCDNKQLDLPIQAPTDMKKRTITFNKTKLADVKAAINQSTLNEDNIYLRYVIGANYIYISERYGAGNATNYQTYYWGYTDLCSMSVQALDYLRTNVVKLQYTGWLNQAPNEVREFRKLVQVTFLGQTSVFTSQEDVSGEMGLSKLIPRTLPQQDYK